MGKKLTRDLKSFKEFKRDARVLLLEEATVRCMSGLFAGRESSYPRKSAAFADRNGSSGSSSNKSSNNDDIEVNSVQRRHERRPTSVSSKLKAVDAFDAQNVGNILWACAAMMYTPRLQILEKFADIIEENVDKLYPQALSNSLWSFARLKEWNVSRSKQVAELLSQQAMRMLPEVVKDVEKAGGMYEAKDVPFGGFSTQAIGNTLWSVGALRIHPGNMIMDEYLRLATQYHDKFKTQEISNSAWACAMLQHHPGELFLNVLSDTLALRGDECTSQAVSNSLLCLATFGFKLNDSLLNALSGKHARRCNSQDMCNSIWSLAAVDAFDAPLYEELWARVSTMHHSEFVDEGLNMLYHASIMHKDRDDELLLGANQITQKKAHEEPRWLHTVAKKSYDNQTLHNVTLSAFHKHVSSQIRGAFIKNVADEHITEDGAMSIDIALLDHKVAIECDGPSHFEKNLEKSVTHKTILRNRGLERRGWRVLMIPYYEWREVVSNDKHQKYLEDKLATIGITQRENVLGLF